MKIISVSGHITIMLTLPEAEALAETLGLAKPQDEEDAKLFAEMARQLYICIHHDQGT